MGSEYDETSEEEIVSENDSESGSDWDDFSEVSSDSVENMLMHS